MIFRTPHMKKGAWFNLDEPESIVKLVRVYWRALLIFSVVCIVGFSMYGVWQLALFSELANMVPSPGVPVSPLDRVQLTDTLESFQVRDARYELLEKNPPNVKDPS